MRPIAKRASRAIDALRTLWLSAGLCALSHTSASEPVPSSTTSALRIQWMVQESFPLLPHAIVTELQAERKLVSAAALYEHLADRWEPGRPILAPVDSTQYDRMTGRYKPGYWLEAGDPVGIFAILTDAQADHLCAWRIERSGAHLQTVEGPCQEWQSLHPPLGQEVTLKVTLLTLPGQPSIQKRIKVRQSATVALGDSYAAGQGNPDVPADNTGVREERPGPDWPFKIPPEGLGKAAQWWDDECQRSLVSWPVMTVLTQALRDERRHTRYVVLTYACSGGELIDGGFLGQTKTSLRARTSSPFRDGLHSDVEGGSDLPYVRRSQLNALYDDRCRGQARRHRLYSVPGHPPVRAWVYDCANPLPVDWLLVSMGGNDLGFASIAMGIFIPDKPRNWYFGPGLALFRTVSGAANLDTARDVAAQYSALYPQAIHLLREAARVPARNTVLVRYPNPIVTASGESLQDKADDGCVDGEVVADLPGRPDRAQRVRVRDSNLVLGSALPRANPLRVGRNWVLSADPHELRGYWDVYQQIQGMQEKALAADTAGGAMLSATYGDHALFNDRRMCDAVERGESIYLPLHMCKATCQAASAMGPLWAPQPPSAYRHYPRRGEARRTMVYSLNESVLSQRSWSDKTPGGQEVRDSLSGAMHPTAEAHAAAADSINAAIQARLREATLP